MYQGSEQEKELEDELNGSNSTQPLQSQNPSKSKKLWIVCADRPHRPLLPSGEVDPNYFVIDFSHFPTGAGCSNENKMTEDDVNKTADCVKKELKMEAESRIVCLEPAASSDDEMDHDFYAQPWKRRIIAKSCYPMLTSGKSLSTADQVEKEEERSSSEMSGDDEDLEPPSPSEKDFPAKE